MSQKALLSVIEFLGYPNMCPLYERLGYKVATEFSVRKAIALMRKSPPDVVVADFFSDSDFRDRVSNLESLLAAAQKQAGCKTLVFYVPSHQDALDKVRQRFRIDAALTLPVKEAELEAVLRDWL